MNLAVQGGDRRFIGAGLLLLAAIAALFTWWGLDAGAYFAPTFYPGELGLLGLLAVLVIGVPLRARLSGPALVALVAVVALGGWALLSILWTPTREAALVDTHKIIIYAALFGLGIWIASLLGDRRDLALLAVGVAGALVAIVATIEIGTGTEALKFLHEDGTLLYPIGYRNANAAFWLIAAWPLLALAVRGGLPWPLRALMLAAVTMLIELTILCQSRGSLPAAAVALVVVVLLSRQGLKTALFAALAALPAVPAVPTLLKVFRHGSADAGSIPLLHHSAVAILLSTLGSVVLALLVLGVLERRVHLAPETTRRLSWTGAAAVIALVVIAAAVVVGHEGGPARFVDQRVDELKEGTPNLRSQGARFGVNIGSNRGDIWRVALDEWDENPIRGGGAGSWQVDYLKKKTVYTPAEDPHSVEMLMLSEFGLPGILLFFSFLGGAVIAAWRGRRLGPASVTLAAGALAVAAQWLVQASYDWLFFYPGVTAPAIFLLGAAAAPAVREGASRLRAAPLLACLGVLLVAAASAAALFISVRYTDRAANEWRTDLGAAYADFDHAASLDPFAVEPLLSKGAVAREAGDTKTAVASFKEALERQSDNFPAHYLLGLTLLRSQPRVALRELDSAHELNPLFFLAADVRCARARVRGPAAARDACRAR
jgi:hypothetical protein